jgi:hypothetical protein
MEFLNFTTIPKPSVLFVELPHREVGGKITPWDDLVCMSTHCRRNGIRFHCDGARLWEAEADYGKPMCELCALFDSIYVSFYKGLDGISGAMLLGKQSFIAESTDGMIRRLGGNQFSLMPLAVSCWSGYRVNKDTFYIKRDKLVEVLAALTEAFIASNDYNCNSNGDDDGSCSNCSSSSSNSLLRFDQPIPLVSFVHIYIRADTALVMQVNETASLTSGFRCFRGRPAAFGATGQCCMEMNLGPLNMSYSIETWLKGWTAFMRELKKQLLLQG